MLERSKQAEDLKKVFERAKDAPRYKDGAIDDLDLHGELQDALVDVRKECFRELIDEVYPYLNDAFWEYREDAVRDLGGPNGFLLPEFKDIAYKMWLEDPNEHVRVAALVAWFEYYAKAKDPDVLKTLYNIAVNEKYSVRARVYAIYGLMLVADAFVYPKEKSDLLDLTDLDDNKMLNKEIDWNKIENIMKQYVLGWKK